MFRVIWLYLITKLQNLKAIHNGRNFNLYQRGVVSNYKITKSESYSQLFMSDFTTSVSCI